MLPRSTHNNIKNFYTLLQLFHVVNNYCHQDFKALIDRVANLELIIEKQNNLLEELVKKLSGGGNNTATDDIEPDEFLLPAKCSNDLEELNYKLNDLILKKKLTSKLMLLGGNNCRLLTIRLIQTLMTKECLSLISWRGTKSKKSMVTNFRNIHEIILLVVKKRYPATDIGTIVETIIKNKCRNSASKEKEISKTNKKKRGSARCNEFSVQNFPPKLCQENTTANTELN